MLIGKQAARSPPAKSCTTVTVFVDTNVLVYARDLTELDKQRRATEWMARLWETRAGRLSQQVLHEYYVVATKKLDPPRAREMVREDVVSLSTWAPVPSDLALIERAWDLEDRFALSWWDSLIVAAALHADCEYLLTEDLQDCQNIEGVRVIDPFQHGPDDFLNDG